MNKDQTKHILIIDDSADQQVLLRMVLEANGYRIDCTSNGKEALLLLDRGHDLPNMILLDVNMPVMDGTHFRRCQSEDPRIKNIPVILMTGDADIQRLQSKIEAAEVLVKPFNIASLLAAVERFSSLH